MMAKRTIFARQIVCVWDPNDDRAGEPSTVLRVSRGVAQIRFPDGEIADRPVSELVKYDPKRARLKGQLSLF